jgi:acyl carrier protein
MKNNYNFKTELKRFVSEILVEKLRKKGKYPLDIDDNFVIIQSGLIDSFGFLEILTAVEEKFNIDIDFSEKDPAEFLSLGAFVNSVYEEYKK